MPEATSAPPATHRLERERALVTALLGLLVVSWVGFAVHRAPDFPGSLLGALLGIAGALLMVGPSLAYTLLKRVRALKRRLDGRLSLRRLLTWHVWAGMLGALLALLHTGHRFESTVGVVLTGLILGVIVSGYVGRHALAMVSLDVRGRQQLLEQLVNAYNLLAGDLAGRHEAAATLRRRGLTRFAGIVGFRREGADGALQDVSHRVAELTGAIADLEFAIQADERLKRRFARWLLVHVAASLAFYLLLALHVWASLYFGLRWLA